MNREGLYGVKNYANVVIRAKGEDVNLDWLNDVHVLKSGEGDAIIIEAQLTSDRIEGLFNKLKIEKCKIELSFLAKAYETGEDTEVKRVFEGMNFSKEISSYSWESPSSIIWVFSNDYYFMRDEISTFIDRILRDREKSREISTLEKIKEGIEDTRYEIKNIYDHYHIADNVKIGMLDKIVKTLESRKDK